MSRCSVRTSSLISFSSGMSAVIMTLRQLSTVSKLCFLVYCQFLDSLRLRRMDPKSQEGVGLSITGICLGTDITMALRYTISPEGLDVQAAINFGGSWTAPPSERSAGAFSNVSLEEKAAASRCSNPSVTGVSTPRVAVPLLFKTSFSPSSLSSDSLISCGHICRW